MKHIVWGLALSMSLFSCSDDDNNKVDASAYERPEEPGDAAFSSDPIVEGESLLDKVGEAKLLSGMPVLYSDKTDYKPTDKFSDFYVVDLPNVKSGDDKTGAKKNEWKQSEGGQKRLEYFKKLLRDDMVFVQGGTFLMGGTAEQGDNLHPSIFPVHKVTVGDFYMCRVEVTQEMYSYVIGKWYKWTFADGEHADYPADNRKMADIITFCKNLSTLTGLTFDLPTEAEWEFAARGGRKRTSTMYAGSNDFSAIGNCFEDCYRFNQVKNNTIAWPLRVMQKAPNELGLYDMSGNMIEVCKEAYGAYSVEDQVNPGVDSDNAVTNLLRVTRGGGFSVTPAYCRLSVRGAVNLNAYNNTVGFRVVYRVPAVQ